ncbi:33042_t:CDS:2, partial [Gigaspora margarita]
MQSFLRLSNFDKHFFYKPLSDLYQEFANAYTYYKQVTLCNPTPNKQKLLNKAQTAWKEIKNENEAVIYKKIQSYLTMASSTIHIQCNFIVHTSFNRASTSMVASSSSISLVILPQLDNSDAIAKNAKAIQQIFECQQAIKMISNQDIKNKLLSKIEADYVIIKVNKKKLGKLKRHAEAQAKLKAKNKNNLTMKISLKIHTIKHLCEVLEKRSNIYLLCQCLSTYLEPQHRHTFAVCYYHHSAKVSLASVARTNMKQHINKHYCLASVKAARVFVA